MKTLLTMIAAFALLVLSPLVRADDGPPPKLKLDEGWYAGVHGGLNWADDYGTTFGPISINSNTDDGGIVGVFVGKHIPSIPGLSFEVEGQYRVNDTNLDVTFVAPPPLITLPGQDSTLALMANARYDIVRGGKVTPYVMVGVGYAERTVELDLVPILLTFEQSKSDVVWQAGAGFDVRLAEHVSAGLRYTYFDGVDMSQPIGPVSWSADGENHAVTAVLTFALN